MHKILVIEDDPHIRNEVVFWLTMEEYTVVAAANGQEGVDFARQECPDLIISDIMMPHKDGYRVLLELRTQPATALIPFIFLSAKQEKEDIRHGMELGADDYITKPFTRDEFLRAIEARLARKKQYVEENERQSNQLRRSLLQILPHELRTPLIGILGVGELLTQDAETLTSTEIAEYGAMISSSGKQLYRLVENHLLFLQLEQRAANHGHAAHSKPNKCEQVNLIIQEVCERVAKERTRLSDLALALQVAPLSIAGQDLAKIVYEIVDNAFKFSTAPSPVKVRTTVQDGSYLLVISDYGRGIAAAQIEAIGAYVQFDRATQEQQGVGLGLAIVRRLVELTGGIFHIESNVGIGTTVHITLPTYPQESLVRL